MICRRDSNTESTDCQSHKYGKAPGNHRCGASSEDPEANQGGLAGRRQIEAVGAGLKPLCPRRERSPSSADYGDGRRRRPSPSYSEEMSFSQSVSLRRTF